MKTAQTGFSFSTTAAEAAAGHDLTGKIAVVTGGNSGIGFETVKTLAEIGAQVVVGARDITKADDRLSGLKNVSFIPLDLADPVSVDAFAKKYQSVYDRLHILVNNAGLFLVPDLQKDKRGYELQFGVNHLGHFQLTGRLWPALKNAGGARVVAVSSIGHRRMDVDLDDANFDKKPYDKWAAYGQSKTANVLFAVELDRAGQADGVRAFALHPGGIQTDIFRFMTEEEKQNWNERVMSSPTPFKTLEQGAATSVWCAISEALQGKGGVYCQDCRIAAVVPEDSPEPLGVRPYAIDPVKAAALWRFSEAATGVRYPV
ncbi:SDR family NAD(P)-dependent oxidoreductase [Dinghuibacter silviterrae]|uniref:Probable oxidoreductase n=1 Tax=Dinghuibacter silviterrae TaxID=1539049 RepID=A0A4R8DFL0_9BACT|nr:SDR family NAD(P)-dependent oxidoreductase [Dinghuibacter silviterrae]TDW96255.1 NAD(P)-dependent dehydrogenase (short-subunit alcohol dehydrogenase family) [Dinghuibacter silviterrae]